MFDLPGATKRPEPDARAFVADWDVVRVRLGSSDSFRERRHARALLDAPRGADAWYHTLVALLPAQPWLESAAVPELPDLAILADALDAGLAGRPLQEARIVQPLVLRGTSAELSGFGRQRLLSVARRGKFLVFEFERDRMILNPMLTGRLGFGAPGSKPLPQSAAVLTFGARQRPTDDSADDPADDPAGNRRAVAAWLRGADWLPADDEDVELRYRDATRMGKLYLLPAGVERRVAGWDEQGPDADDADLTLERWRARIARHSGELKNLLRNQAFVAGIGNAYSDEILWAARLAPYRTRASLAADEVDALHGALRQVLPWAIHELHTRVPPRLEVEQRGFLNVHMKGGQPCPRCGSVISEVKAGGSVTNFCRGCQR
jgi:formamidopyrimidine-DNA glycosylase